MSTDEVSHLAELLQRSVNKFPDNAIFGTRQPDGTWNYITYSEFGELVDAFRGGLASLGVVAGDRVAVISDNRTEWAVGAYATYGLGAVYVPMYQKQNPKDWKYILEDCSAKVLLAANDDVASAASAFTDEVESLKHIINFEAADGYAALLETGRANPVGVSAPPGTALCGLIYTSGTTGQPKGVQLSHGNICSNVNAVMGVFPMLETDRSLSFLPWAHSFGQTVELHCGISFGASMAICDDVNQLIPYLSEVRPSVLYSVPRVFNKIYDSLNKKLAAAPEKRQKLFATAMAVANTKRELEEQGKSSLIVNIKHWIFDRLVFKKVRALLGGNLRYAFSGGAAISPEVARFIDNMGITVYEGYGLSETSPIATANFPGSRKIGSVGRAIPGVEIIIDTAAVGGAEGDQGEILIKGPNVMQGYHNLPDKTAEVMRADGAFRSGDLGRMDNQGFVFITGRLKEQYKLQNGKYVVPSPLEEQLTLSGFINQALVFGDNKSHNVALIVPDIEALKGWAASEGISGDVGDLLASDKVRELYGAQLDRYQESVFKGFEKIKNFAFVEQEFSTENEMLTPTMKLKRRNVIKTYQPVLDALYN
jgi:long-chain acyl-CoA synthetase